MGLFNKAAVLKTARDQMKSVAKFLAIDTRRAAQASIKSGGKSRKSKSYKTSEPGAPPFYHRSTFKNTIQIASDGDDWIVGPTKDPRFRTSGVRALEAGGISMQRRVVAPRTEQPKRTFYKTVEKLRGRKDRKKLVAVRVKKTVADRRTERGIETQLGRKTYRYQYFWSRENWERARTSPEFVAWANGYAVVRDLPIYIRRRPFMRPALIRIVAPANVERKIRAVAK